MRALFNCPLTGNKEWSKGLTVLRANPTPTRFSANSVFIPMGNTPLGSIPSVAVCKERRPLFKLMRCFAEIPVHSPGLLPLLLKQLKSYSNQTLLHFYRKWVKHPAPLTSTKAQAYWRPAVKGWPGTSHWTANPRLSTTEQGLGENFRRIHTRLSRQGCHYPRRSEIPC